MCVCVCVRACMSGAWCVWGVGGGTHAYVCVRVLCCVE